MSKIASFWEQSWDLKFTLILPFFQKVNISACKTFGTSVLINFKCPGLFFVIGVQRQRPVTFILKNSQALNKYIYQELRDFGESYLSETETILRTALKVVLNRKKIYGS